MGKRHSNALYIQEGACNPSGILHSMLEACQEIRSEPNHQGTDDLRKDEALRLMTHQLAYLMGIPTNEDLLEYGRWTEFCRAKAKAEGLAVP